MTSFFSSLFLKMFFNICQVDQKKSIYLLFLFFFLKEKKYSKCWSGLPLKRCVRLVSVSKVSLRKSNVNLNFQLAFFFLYPNPMEGRGKKKSVWGKCNSVGSLTMQVFGGVAQQKKKFFSVCTLLPQAPCRNFFFFACTEAIFYTRVCIDTIHSSFAKLWLHTNIEFGRELHFFS